MHAWTCKVATAHTHGRFFPFTYIHTNVMHVCVCVWTLAHLRIHGSKNLDQWAAQQQSSAAQRRSAFLYTLLSNAAFTHTHTCIQLRCLQNRLQPQCNPKKKQRCQRHRLQPRPRRSALLSLSSTLILSLPHSLALFIFVHCIS